MTEGARPELPDWGRLSHAYGPAADTPGQLANLTSPIRSDQEKALEHLWGAVLHQGTTYPATAPAAVAVSRLLADPRTLTPVSHWTDLSQPPPLLRVSLIDFLAAVAASTTHEPPGASFDAWAQRHDEEVERVVASLWRGDFDISASDAVLAQAADVCLARSVLESRRVLGEIAPRILVHLTAADLRVRQSAANASATFAEALKDKRFTARVLSTLEAMALNAEGIDRASLVLSIGKLEGEPKRFLDDPDFVVRSCAALAPALSQDSKATGIVLEALTRPNEIDDLANRLPQFEMRPRFAFVKASVERAATFEELLPGALAIAAVGNAYTVENDCGPLLARAFPEPYRPGVVLSPSQRAYLQALVSNEDIWSNVLGNPRPWFKRVGLLYDREACREIVNQA